MEYRIDTLHLLLNDAARAIRRQFQRRAADHGLSPAQWRLVGITLREGPLTQVTLAERLEVEPMSVSRLVDRLQAAGWVERAPHPGDRRAHLVQATDRARAIAPALRREIGEICAEALSGLSDAERRCFERGLRNVIETLGDGGAAGEASAAG